MQVERQLDKQPRVLEKLRSRLEVAVTQAEELGPTNESVIETLNTAYQETISTLKFRIMSRVTTSTLTKGAIQLRYGPSFEWRPRRNVVQTTRWRKTVASISAKSHIQRLESIRL